MRAIRRPRLVLVATLLLVFAVSATASAVVTAAAPETACDKFASCVGTGSFDCLWKGIECLAEQPWLDWFN